MTTVPNPLHSFVSATNQNPRTCLFAGLQDARNATGRDGTTGAKLSGVSHGSWLGSLGYMAVLDQIGGCFETAKTGVTGSSIERALRHFTTLTEADIQAIYALRCAFAHDYSLHNVHNQPARTHQFAVCADSTSPLITFPTTQWDGLLTSLSASTITLVNLEILGDLVEDVYQEVVSHAAANTLIVRLTGGFNQLQRQYAIRIS